MQKERLEEMKRKFDNYLQRFPDPESGPFHGAPR